ncbi:MAG: glycosyltransferase family 2 protein [Verrucomicrobiaceae bacterium]
MSPTLETAPCISVIISNFNGAKYLPRLLSTLRRQQGVTLQIIVVDRHSSDESNAILAQQPDVSVVKHPPETGLVSGYAAGTSEATEDLFFFMNEDMWLAPDCLLECVSVLTSKPNIASVMPVQWTYDGTAIVNAGIWFEYCLWNRACPTLQARSKWHLVAKPSRVSYANAGACLVRRDAYTEVGGWDTTFFLDDEDTDIAIRFWQRGWECWVAPDATIGHAVGASNTKKLTATATPVSVKRYVSALSNFLMVALKTFSLSTIPRAFLAWTDRLLRNVAKGRWKLVGLDFKALRLTISRMSDANRFRQTNHHWNQQRPGQGFFREPVFQWSAIRDNVSDRCNVLPEAATTVVAE